MLRYQINPHFLYNTLNLIASMGELSDFPEIVEITKNLSCIMQYNVKGSRFVSLKTEVEILFCEDEIRDTYIDDGNVQNLKAKIEEGTLFINTDMDASYFTVYAEKCLDNAVVNGQNWEIKKEKEGYYKIALEK